MNKLNKILLGIVVILLAVMSIILWKPDFLKSLFSPSYYAVYFLNGDLYFGKMSWCSRGILSDARLLQKNDGSATDQSNFNLVKFKDVFWGPQGDLKFNEKNVLWTAKLSSESQVVKILQNDQK
jgi:hypothetical protein